MELTDLFMRGAELRDPDRVDPRPLDFAVWNEQNTLLALADWWTLPWGMGTGFVVISAPLDPVTLLFDGLRPELQVAPPSDEFFALRCDQARRRTDLQRAKYLRELQALVEFEPDFDFTDWIAAIQDRPVVDVRRESAKMATAMRSIGRIRVVDAREVAVDALVIDELGNSAVANPDGWLALFGEQWSGYDDADRPEVGAFLDWLKTQNPYGPLALASPEVYSDGGELMGHVTRALTPAT